MVQSTNSTFCLAGNFQHSFVAFMRVTRAPASFISTIRAARFPYWLTITTPLPMQLQKSSAGHITPNWVMPRQIFYLTIRKTSQQVFNNTCMGTCNFLFVFTIDKVSHFSRMWQKLCHNHGNTFLSLTFQLGENTSQIVQLTTSDCTIGNKSYPNHRISTINAIQNFDKN